MYIDLFIHNLYNVLLYVKDKGCAERFNPIVRGVEARTLAHILDGNLLRAICSTVLLRYITHPVEFDALPLRSVETDAKLIGGYLGRAWKLAYIPRRLPDTLGALARVLALHIHAHRLERGYEFELNNLTIIFVV